ncbi:MAG: ceramidase domain-containing protein [Pseudomonadota bacterium]
MTNKTTRIIAVWGGFLILCVAVFIVVPAIPQDLSYHNFANSGALWGVPNFADVVSNIPFVFVGIMGLWTVAKLPYAMLSHEHWFWLIFFVGVLLVGFGSGYYHWTPNNSTLVWDRLPMTIGFMSLFAFVIFDRMGRWHGLVLLPILLVLGSSSVFYWDYTESLGAGDLRPYAIVQFGPFLFIISLFLLFSSHYTGGKYFVRVFLWYALAKVFEHFDHGIYQISHGMVSGHTLKHLASAMACYEVIQYLRMRRLLPKTKSSVV